VSGASTNISTSAAAPEKTCLARGKADMPQGKRESSRHKAKSPTLGWALAFTFLRGHPIVAAGKVIIAQLRGLRFSGS
ncbi:hypothetical protein, partial [Mesorhizobium sp.]|uniref:hypothetical protein n=1 Tax=Mesorhizobium sp. TaxID=1871066 RepID=UPI0025E62D3C